MMRPWTTRTWWWRTETIWRSPGRGAANRDGCAQRSHTSSWWPWRTSSGRRATCPCARDWTWPWPWTWPRPRSKFGSRIDAPSGRNKTRGLTLIVPPPPHIPARDFTCTPRTSTDPRSDLSISIISIRPTWKVTPCWTLTRLTATIHIYHLYFEYELTNLYAQPLP